MSDTDNLLSRKKINQETSQILWAELQRFFASGLAIHVDREFDLVDVAWRFAQDDKHQVESWLKQGWTRYRQPSQTMAGRRRPCLGGSG